MSLRISTVKAMWNGLCLIALITTFSSSAHAAPIAFGANAYEFVLVADPLVGANNSWFTASAAAAASVFNSVSGHLATVSSQQENDFLLGLVSSQPAGFNGAWLGGKSPQGWLEGPETGQSFGYTNWGGIEPNNSGYAYMSIGVGGIYAAGLWADDSGTQGFPAGADPVIGYFVEYENAAVPIPGAAWLLGSALVGLRLRQDKQNR